MKRLLTITLFILFLQPTLVFAGETRTNLPRPAGLTIINLYYSHAFGNEYYSRFNKKSDSANLASNMGVFHPIYYSQLGSVPMNMHVVVPFGGVDVSNVESNGVGDITLFTQWWLINNPENKFFFVYAPYFTLPTGQYRPGSSVNLGDNRWSTRQEVAFVKGFGEKTWLEVLFDVEFYTSNDNMRNALNRRVSSSKDPVFGTEAHLSYDLTSNFIVSLDYYYNYGGETHIDGVRQYDWKNTHLLGPTFFFLLNKNMNLMLAYEVPLSTENGIKTSRFWTRLAYEW